MRALSTFARAWPILGKGSTMSSDLSTNPSCVGINAQTKVGGRQDGNGHSLGAGLIKTANGDHIVLVNFRSSLAEGHMTRFIPTIQKTDRATA